ncbi:MAG: hypothetical protein ACJAZO_004342 [Myxococcota bacterium]|jgi:hypothetical protein
MPKKPVGFLGSHMWLPNKRPKTRTYAVLPY